MMIWSQPWRCEQSDWPRLLWHSGHAASYPVLSDGGSVSVGIDAGVSDRFRVTADSPKSIPLSPSPIPHPPAHSSADNIQSLYMVLRPLCHGVRNCREWPDLDDVQVKYCGISLNGFACHCAMVLEIAESEWPNLAMFKWYIAAPPCNRILFFFFFSSCYFFFSSFFSTGLGVAWTSNRAHDLNFLGGIVPMNFFSLSIFSRGIDH